MIELTLDMALNAQAEWNKLRKRIASLEAENAALQRENEGLRKDAERYRLIKRDHEVPWDVEPPSTVVGRFYVMFGREPIGCIEGELDAAIDAALSQPFDQQGGEG